MDRNDADALGQAVRSPNGPVALAAELDDLVARVRCQDGDDVDPSEVWLLIARYALARAREVTVTEINAAEETPNG